MAILGKKGWRIPGPDTRRNGLLREGWFLLLPNQQRRGISQPSTVGQAMVVDGWCERGSARFVAENWASAGGGFQVERESR